MFKKISTYFLIFAVVFSLGVFSISAGQKHSSIIQTKTVEAATEKDNSATVDGEPDAHAEEASTEENSGIAGMFGINLKLFIAQLINFGVILFVLWKWVFTPLTKGLSERTAKIEASLKDAEDIGKERANFNSWKEEQMITARKEASEILNKAKTDTEVIKQRILDDTKKEQEKLTEQANATMLQNKNSMVSEAKTEIAEMIIKTTEKILQGELSPAKHKQIINSTLESAKENS